MQAAHSGNFGDKCKHSVNESLFAPGGLPLPCEMCYTMHTIPNRRLTNMSSRSRRKQDTRQLLVRIISLALAVLMVLSVVMAYVWQW